MFPEGRLLDFLIVGAVALIVVGPKDLPVLMRKVGQFVAKMRGMAAEFRASFDELARQSELDELRKEVEAMRRSGPLGLATTAIAGTDTLAVFEEIHSGLGAPDGQVHPPLDSPAPAAIAEASADAAPAPAKKPRKPRAPAKRPAARKKATSGAKARTGAS